MRTVTVKFIESIQRTPTVVSFRFQPQELVSFIPGQFCQVMFDPQNPGNKDLNKYLSFSCAPNKQYLEVTKRLSESLFSTALKNLKSGDKIVLKLALGQCVFKPEMKKIAFLIGGIGITPVISILECIHQQNLDTDVLLMYSNRTEDDIAFKPEIEAWRKDNPRFKVCYSITGCEPKDKTCYYGPICQDMLNKSAVDLKDRITFIFGPPRMVEAMQELVLNAGYSKENIKTENFVGY